MKRSCKVAPVELAQGATVKNEKLQLRARGPFAGHLLQVPQYLLRLYWQDKKLVQRLLQHVPHVRLLAALHVRVVERVGVYYGPERKIQRFYLLKVRCRPNVLGKCDFVHQLQKCVLELGIL